MDFKKIAKSVCNGCDLVTGDENKLETKDVCSYERLTVQDFATCVIDEKTVGVVTFEEAENKFYWGGDSLTKTVVALISQFDSEEEAREEYKKAKKSDKIALKFEATKTKNGRDFTKVTVLD